MPSYMSQQNLMKETMDSCCDGYYWWDLEHCTDNSAGEDAAVDGDGPLVANDAAAEVDTSSPTSPPTSPPSSSPTSLPGSKEWYADYEGFRCVQDCPIIPESSSPNSSAHPDLRCGGLASPSVTVANGTSFVALGGTGASGAASSDGGGTTPALHPTAEECCRSQFSYLALGLCVASSEHDGEGDVDYSGSGEYYVDYENGRCVQDCAPPASDDADPSAPSSSSSSDPSSAGGICGGIVAESSTALYANATACCSARLSYMDPFLCETRSEAGGAEEGTFRLYPRASSGTCVIDYDPSHAIICSIGYTCDLLSPKSWVSKLYPVSPSGVEECCRVDLSHVNPSYCRAKTMGIVSRKWFVNYAEGVCHQDCEVGTGPSCALNADPAVTYYDTPQECCSSKLGYRSQPLCVADSTHAVYEGTGRYYVDYRNSRCARDCPAGGNATNAADCAGVAEDSNAVLHDDAAGCCATSMSYMSQELCEDRSNGTATGTGMYYPISAGICVKDTSATPCPSGETCQRVDGWVSTLYDAIAECCDSDDYALPSNVNPKYCRAVSDGTGTDGWFLHPDGDRCAKHCASGDEGVECAAPSDPTTSYHPTAQGCCLVELGHLNSRTCAEFSEKGGILEDLAETAEYYVDWIRQACVRNCPEGSAGECGGIAAGKWVVLHPNITSCCEDLHYIDETDCLVKP